jgi:hypothetical protein
MEARLADVSRSHFRMSCQEVDPFWMRIWRQESAVCTVLNMVPNEVGTPRRSARWANAANAPMTVEIDANVQNGTEDSFFSDTK